MTSHAIDREEVMAYVDGELDANRSAEIETHLKGCEDCRSLVGELRAVSMRLATWHVADAEDQLVAIRHRVLGNECCEAAEAVLVAAPGNVQFSTLGDRWSCGRRRRDCCWSLDCQSPV